MNSIPRVSVLIPTYNRAQYLRLAVASVLAQTFHDYELLILDDASTDQSREAIHEFLADPRISYFRHPVNLGITANRNSGLAHARGEYIAMLDSDDVWLDPSKLQRQVDALDADPHCGMVGTFARILDSAGKVTGDLTPYSDGRQIRRALLIRNQFVQSSVMVRKRTIDLAGGYDATVPVWEDYDLWLRMGKIAEFRNLPLPLTGYRLHEGNMTNFVEDKSIVSYWEIYQRHRKAYPFGFLLWLKAVLLTCRFHLKQPWWISTSRTEGAIKPSAELSREASDEDCPVSAVDAWR